LSAADGEGYFAGGNCKLNANGLEMLGTGYMIRLFDTSFGATPDHMIHWSSTGMTVISQVGTLVLQSASAHDIWLTAGSANGNIFCSGGIEFNMHNLNYLSLPHYNNATGHPSGASIGAIYCGSSDKKVWVCDGNGTWKSIAP
jgi:hypothetical protein